MDTHYRRDDPAHQNTTMGLYERKEVDSAPAMKRKRALEEAAASERESRNQDRKILAQFRNEAGDSSGPPVELPHDVTPKELIVLINKLLDQDEEPNPYSFFVDETEITSELSTLVDEKGLQTESVIPITYQPQAVFRVRAIARCSATIPGHADNIVELYFSPNGQHLASGSGDCTVRFWDIWTQTPKFTCKGHRHWVQCISWAPDGTALASGSRDNEIRVWDPETGKELCKPIKGHRQFINWISWEPLHSSKSNKCRRFASASKDATVRIWDYLKTGTPLVMSLGQHTKSVTCVKWGGEGLIYTASQDRDIHVWRAEDGTLCRSLKGHAHWVNSISLNTDYVLRTGPYNERGVVIDTGVSLKEAARKRYEAVKGPAHEKLVSGSEDNTMYLWEGATSKKPIANRMTGHQKPIMYVSFSPDGRHIASSSMDKSCKIWNGASGTFEGNLRAHCGPVYRHTWAPDSRMIVTGSEDSTMKLWRIRNTEMVSDLPGHAGSVFACDWAPNGGTVASGGADKTLKL